MGIRSCAGDRRDVVPRRRGGECDGRRAVRRRESERPAARHIPARARPGADLLQPSEHGAAVRREQQVYVKVHRRSQHATLPVRLRSLIHDVRVQRSQAQRAARPCDRHGHRDRDGGQHRKARRHRGRATLRAGRSRQCEPACPGAEGVSARDPETRRIARREPARGRARPLVHRVGHEAGRRARHVPHLRRTQFRGGSRSELRMHSLILVALLQAHPTVCYEIFVRSFYDSNGDGIGDLRGLTQKLDYVEGLGADCVWLMPVAESPSYHGYDVTNDYKIEPDYGTNDDFRAFVTAAHQRHVRVLVDLVLNHVSSEHPFFQEALRDSTAPHRGWFRWSKTGGNNWHHSPVRDEYYYGLFWSGMPDLNYQTPAVREEAKKVATFWLREMGVDGFRLDAVPYLVEEGTCLIGCPGTHAFLHEYAAHIDSVKPGAYTVGEAWGGIDQMLPYYPDQLTAYFGFELSDSLIAAVRSGSAAGLLTGYLRLQDTLPAYRWAPFLSNHDQTRTLTQLGGDVARAQLAATLLLTLPGTPFIYYGEE